VCKSHLFHIVVLDIQALATSNWHMSITSLSYKDKDNVGLSRFCHWSYLLTNCAGMRISHLIMDFTHNLLLVSSVLIVIFDGSHYYDTPSYVGDLETPETAEGHA
jgi:hypothetical protein